MVKIAAALLSVVLSVGYVQATTLEEQVSQAYTQCQNEFWFWDLIDIAGECTGRKYKPIFELSGIGGNKLEKTQDGHFWLPIRGKMVIGPHAIIVSFEMDTDAVGFFKTKFLNTQGRMPIALEVDVADLSNKFRAPGQVIGLNFPQGAEPALDTNAFDWGKEGYGVVIRRPDKLEAGVIYTLVFHPEGAPWYAPWESEEIFDGTASTRLNFQVAINVPRVNDMIAAYDSGDHSLDQYVNEPENSVWDYFLVETDGFRDMVIPENTEICWYAKVGDDLGCNKGNPFVDIHGEAVLSANGAIPQQQQTVMVMGASYPNDQGESVTYVGPDGNIKRVEVSLANQDSYHHSLTIVPGQAFDIEVKITNKGDTAFEEGDVEYYISDNLTFNESMDTRLGQDENIELGPDGSSSGSIKKHWRDVVLTQPGIYYVFCKIEVPEDVNSSNNFSRHDDVEEYARIIVAAPPKTFLADVNGDGRADLILFYDIPGHEGEWWVALSNPGGHFEPFTLWADWCGSGSKCQFVSDVNADGRADIIMFFDDAVCAGEWWVALSTTANNFGYLSLWAQYLGVGSTQQFVADVNGDRFADAVMYYQNTSHPNGDWYVGLATANNSFAYTNSLWATWLGKGAKSLFLADVNGDGRADVVMFYDDNYHPGDWFVGLATVQSTFAYTGTYWARSFGVGSSKQFMVDLNGDRFMDPVLYYSGTATWHGAVTDSGGYFANPATWTSGIGFDSLGQLLGDVNGDGYWDACLFYDTPNNPRELWVDLAYPPTSQFNYLTRWMRWVYTPDW